MGADNQAEKIINRIERMEKMQVEIAQLRQEKERLYVTVADRDKEIVRLRTENEDLRAVLSRVCSLEQKP